MNTGELIQAAAALPPDPGGTPGDELPAGNRGFQKPETKDGPELTETPDLVIPLRVVFFPIADRGFQKPETKDGPELTETPDSAIPLRVVFFPMADRGFQKPETKDGDGPEGHFWNPEGREKSEP